MTSYFVWLGSGRARKRGVGESGRFLDEAARAGLPVRSGAILLDEFYRLAVDERMITLTARGQMLVNDAELLYGTLFHSIRLPRFNRPITIRAIVGDVSGPVPSRDGNRYVPVAQDDAHRLAAALCSVWAVVGHDGLQLRHDVVLQEALPAVISGVATTIGEATADAIVANEAPAGPVQALDIPRLTRWQRPDASLPDFAQRLQQLIRGLRRTIATRDLHFEWADDGEICRLEWLSSAGPMPQT